MAKFELGVDMALFRRGIIRLGRGYKSVRETIRKQGIGETINSRRKKEAPEKRKPDHGRAIAWMFRTKFGKDLFKTSGEDFNRVLNELVDDYQNAIEKAFDDESGQNSNVKRALLIAAQEWAMAVQDRLEGGYLGPNKKRAKAKKEGLIKAGLISAEYGTPPPRGIRSGRWLRGIRGRWRQGRL